MRPDEPVSRVMTEAVVAIEVDREPAADGPPSVPG